MKQEINYMKRRWLVLVCSCLINLVIGALYVWSVFAGPMAEHLNLINGTALTAASLAIVFSVGNSDGFITLIAGGFINQKFGPRWVIFAGGILFGLGFVICGLAKSIAMLIIGYGIFCGLAMGLVYGCTISNSVKFFPDKAGLVGGIATASYGISSVILPPIANILIDQAGVAQAFVKLGIIIIAVVGVFSQFIVKCPDDFIPDGWEPKTVKKVEAAPVTVEKDWKQMLASPVFYVMIIMLFFGAVLGMMAISQASNIAQTMIGMTAAKAAVVVSILALFNTFGRIVAGYISDKIGCINTLAGVFVVAVIGLVALYVSGSGSASLFYIGICLIGVCFGAFMGVYPSFTAENFGRKNSSVNYGIMFIGFSAAGFIGPQIMSRVFNYTGSYRFAFIIATGLAIVGLGLSFVYRIVVKRL